METQFFESYGYEYSSSGSGFVTIFLLIVGGAFICGALFVVWKKREKIFPKLTAQEWLNQELDTLLKDLPQKEEDGKRFYFSLFRLVKEYFFREKGWVVSDKTDEELLEFLQNKKCDTVVCNELMELIRGSQEIKFAHAHALQEQLLKDAERLRKISTILSIPKV